MKKLLQLEFTRLARRTSFYVCLAISVGLLFLSDLSASAIAKITPELASVLSTSVVACVVNALNNSSFTIIAGIFTVLFICEDYEQQTIKNICAKGFSRNKIFSAKAISMLTSTTVMFAVIEIFAFISSSLFFETGSANASKIVFIIATQYAVAVANSFFAFVIAILIRRIGIAITVIVVAPLVLDLTLTILDTLIKTDSFSFTSLWITSFLPYISVLSVSSEKLILSLVTALLYIALFVVLGLFINKKKDF